jgi:clarin
LILGFSLIKISFHLFLLGTGLALLSSAVGAVASVIKSASASRKSGTMVILMMSNFSAAFTQVFAFICWLFQFYNYLTHNVLLQEDVDNLWYTKNMASLGHSFYFIVIGIVVTFVNVAFLMIAIKIERSERRRVEQPCDEKMQGAIMLY